MQFYRVPEAVSNNITLKAPRTGDAGFDLPALEAVSIEAGKSALIRTGIHIAIPLGWVGIVRDRSSTAMKGAICGAGVIDASYRGEVKVLLWNFGTEPLVFSPGDRVAQLVCIQHHSGERLEEVSSIEGLGTTDRGKGGFGSTGL